MKHTENSRFVIEGEFFFNDANVMAEALRYLLDARGAQCEAIIEARQAAQVSQEIYEDMALIESVVEDSATCTHDIDKPLNAASEIPAIPLSELKPIAKAIKAADKNLHKKGGLKDIIGDLFTISEFVAEKLAGLLLMARYNLAVNQVDPIQENLRRSLSVSEQITEKYGTENLPKELRVVTRKLSDVSDLTRKKLKPHVELIEDILPHFHALTRLEDVTAPITEARKKLVPVQRKIHSLLKTCHNLVKPLNNVISAFEKYGKKAIDTIEKKLKDHGINLKFIHDLEKSIDEFIDGVINKLLSPLKSIKDRLCSQMHELMKKIDPLLGNFITANNKVNDKLEQLNELLIEYIDSAAKVHIYPK